MTFLIFTALGITIFIEKAQLTKQLAHGCALNSGIIYEIDQMYVRGGEILCSEVCPCNVDSGIFTTELKDKMVTDTMGATKLEDCPFDSSVVSEMQKEKYYPFLMILESDFECSGMCSDAPYYMFSDVRNGVPKNGNCKDEFIEAVNQHSAIIAVVLITLGIVGFVGVGMSFSICYMNRKKYQGKGPYDPTRYGTAKNE